MQSVVPKTVINLQNMPQMQGGTLWPTSDHEDSKNSSGIKMPNTSRNTRKNSSSPLRSRV